MTMLRRTPPDQPIPPEEVQNGTTRDGDGEPRRYTFVSWNPFRHTPPQEKEDQPQRDGGYVLTLTIAFILLVAVAAATMYVSFEAQVRYTEAVKGDSPEMQLANHLAAISWDMAALTFALLGLATAMRGQSALRARLGNLACVAASVFMNAAPASLERPETLLVWMGPPLLYAAVSDTIILEIQNRAMAKRGLSIKHASLWSVLGLILGRVLGIIAWFVRVVFAPVETVKKFRTWYLDEVPYAPGRTREGDKAREALERAGSAEEIAKRVKAESAATVAAAESAAAQRVEAAEAKAAQRIQEIQEQAAQQIKDAVEEQTAHAEAVIAAEVQRREALEADHQTARAALEKEIQDLHEKLERGLAQARQEQERALSEQRQRHDQELSGVRGQLDQAQRALRDARSEISRYSQELQTVMGSLSGRNQVVYLYDRMRREGDHRYGRPEYVSEVADEFIRHGVGIESTGTVARYLREILAESGPQSNGVAPVGAGSIGGGL